MSPSEYTLLVALVGFIVGVTPAWGLGQVSMEEHAKCSSSINIYRAVAIFSKDNQSMTPASQLVNLALIQHESNFRDVSGHGHVWIHGHHRLTGLDCSVLRDEFFVAWLIPQRCNNSEVFCWASSAITIMDIQSNRDSRLYLRIANPMRPNPCTLIAQHRFGHNFCALSLSFGGFSDGFSILAPAFDFGELILHRIQLVPSSPSENPSKRQANETDTAFNFSIKGKVAPLLKKWLGMLIWHFSLIFSLGFFYFLVAGRLIMAFVALVGMVIVIHLALGLISLWRQVSYNSPTETAKPGTAYEGGCYGAPLTTAKTRRPYRSAFISPIPGISNSAARVSGLEPAMAFNVLS